MGGSDTTLGWSHAQRLLQSGRSKHRKTNSLPNLVTHTALSNEEPGPRLWEEDDTQRVPSVDDNSLSECLPGPPSAAASDGVAASAAATDPFVHEKTSGASNIPLGAVPAAAAAALPHRSHLDFYANNNEQREAENAWSSSSSPRRRAPREDAHPIALQLRSCLPWLWPVTVCQLLPSLDSETGRCLSSVTSLAACLSAAVVCTRVDGERRRLLLTGLGSGLMLPVMSLHLCGPAPSRGVLELLAYAGLGALLAGLEVTNMPCNDLLFFPCSLRAWYARCRHFAVSRHGLSSSLCGLILALSASATTTTAAHRDNNAAGSVLNRVLNESSGGGDRSIAPLSVRGWQTFLGTLLILCSVSIVLNMLALVSKSQREPSTATPPTRGGGGGSCCEPAAEELERRPTATSTPCAKVKSSFLSSYEERWAKLRLAPHVLLPASIRFYLSDDDKQSMPGHDHDHDRRSHYLIQVLPLVTAVAMLNAWMVLYFLRSPSFSVLGPTHLGLLLAVHGFGHVVFCQMASQMIIFTKRWILSALACLLLLGLLLILCLWQPSTSDKAIFYVIAFVWGAMAALWDFATISSVGVFFTSSDKSVHVSRRSDAISGLFHTHRFFGMAVLLAFDVSSSGSSQRVVLIVLAALVLLATVPFVMLELHADPLRLSSQEVLLPTKKSPRLRPELPFDWDSGSDAGCAAGASCDVRKSATPTITYPL